MICWDSLGENLRRRKFWGTKPYSQMFRSDPFALLGGLFCTFIIFAENKEYYPSMLGKPVTVTFRQREL